MLKSLQLSKLIHGSGKALQSTGRIYEKFPAKVELEADKDYYWCACGRSRTQPFCDGSHEREKTGITPVKYRSNHRRTVSFCNCKQTGHRPMCDGTHKKI